MSSFVPIECADVEVILNPGDFEVGAVEIKDADTDTRAVVSTTPPDAGDAGLGVRVIGTITLSPSDSASLMASNYAEDAAHASSSIGTFILAVRNDDAATTLSDTAGDYAPIAVDLKGRPITTTSGSTLNAGVETAVSSAAVQIVAAGANRKGIILQNNGTGDVRIGPTGVTATTGMKLIPGDTIMLTGGATPTNALFAIRQAAVDSIVLVQVLS